MQVTGSQSKYQPKNQCLWEKHFLQKKSASGCLPCVYQVDASPCDSQRTFLIRALISTACAMVCVAICTLTALRYDLHSLWSVIRHDLCNGLCTISTRYGPYGGLYDWHLSFRSRESTQANTSHVPGSSLDLPTYTMFITRFFSNGATALLLPHRLEKRFEKVLNKERSPKRPFRQFNERPRCVYDF